MLILKCNSPNLPIFKNWHTFAPKKKIMKAKLFLVISLFLVFLGLRGQVPLCYTFDNTPRIKHKAPVLNPTGIHTFFYEDSLKLYVEFYRDLGAIDVVLYRNGVEIESDSFYIEAMTGLEYDFTNAQTGTYTIVIVKDDEEIYQNEFCI